MYCTNLCNSAPATSSDRDRILTNLAHDFPSGSIGFDRCTDFPAIAVCNSRSIAQERKHVYRTSR
jgi:hypothetical protein